MPCVHSEMQPGIVGLAVLACAHAARGQEPLFRYTFAEGQFSPTSQYSADTSRRAAGEASLLGDLSIDLNHTAWLSHVGLAFAGALPAGAHSRRPFGSRGGVMRGNLSFEFWVDTAAAEGRILVLGPAAASAADDLLRIGLARAEGRAVLKCNVMFGPGQRVDMPFDFDIGTSKPRHVVLTMARHSGHFAWYGRSTALSLCSSVDYPNRQRQTKKGTTSSSTAHIGSAGSATRSPWA